jgi:diaminohydroxyphosphoribosylaminopyrimidine deaminase / 5-amino-6-(5-phosphoribosylamino)uracil reductase
MQEDTTSAANATHKWLTMALQLASAQRHIPSPNPAIGCVITASDGRLIAQGVTQAAGGAHAEIMALRQASELGHSVQGATAYVTLEPCAHQGRTGPCCEALIAAGIKHVICTHTDPNPLVAGLGFARLRSAGVGVDVLPPNDALALEARALNIGFFSRMVRKTPWVRMKLAASLDGKTALPNGQSQWITSQAARADGHAWRARACAVLTGIGTVQQDNPRLDVRNFETSRQPTLVVVDSNLQTPPDAHLFIAKRQIWLYAAVQNSSKAAALTARGAEVICLPALDADGTPTGKVDLAALLKDLALREVNEVHVEAGHKLNGSLIREGLVDELLIYLAPKMLGSGAEMASFGPFSHLSEALALTYHSIDRQGEDLRILARVTGRDVF